MRWADLRQADWLSADRVWRIATVFVVVSLFLTAWDFVGHTTHGVMDFDGEQLARDFINYWTGARLAIEGRAAMAYDTAAYHAYQRELVGALSSFRMYSYPPTAMLMSLPLAALGFIPGLALWTLAGIAWTARLLSQVAGWRYGAIAAFAAPAAYINTLSGQNGQFSAGFLAGGLMLLDRRPILAGVLFGCLTYKPQLGVLLPIALAAGGHWRSIAAAAVTGAALAAFSVVTIGVDAWAGFAAQSVVQRALLEHGYTLWHRMPTVFATARSLGAGIAFAYVLQIASGLLAAIAVAWTWRGDAPLPIKAAVLAIATFLVTPYSWDYDLVITVFAVCWIVRDAQARGFLPWEKLTLAALVVMPMLVGPICKGTALQVGPVVLWAALGVTLRRALAFSPRLPAASPGLSAASR